jgi:alpha-glucosidase
VYQGVVWPGPAVYPDWFHETTQDFWTNEFALFFDETEGLDIDALWIDMNEPSNFCLWPCDDPVGFTRDSGWINAPPAPPRTDRPSIPGFPSDFQPSPPSIQRRERGVSTVQTPFRSGVRLDQGEGGSKKGLPGRDLINPKYKINNAAGSLSNHTANTNLLHSNGIAEYDSHNL